MFEWTVQKTAKIKYNRSIFKNASILYCPWSDSSMFEWTGQKTVKIIYNSSIFKNASILYSSKELMYAISVLQLLSTATIKCKLFACLWTLTISALLEWEELVLVRRREFTTVVVVENHFGLVIINHCVIMKMNHPSSGIENRSLSTPGINQTGSCDQLTLPVTLLP